MSDIDDGLPNIIGQTEKLEISTKFTSHTHSGAILSKMNELRSEEYDVEIIATEKVIKAHRLVLKSASSYFAAMFNSGMKESESNKIQVDFEYDIMAPLVDFLYTGELTVNSDNVYGLYQASDFYEISTARSFCSQFLVNTLGLSRKTLRY